MADDMKVNATGAATAAAAAGQLWRVAVTEERTVAFWVIAPDRETAQRDADEIGSSTTDWDEVERDADVTNSNRMGRVPAPGEWVWTGGSQGQALTIEEP